jgi:DNA-directed RNA polymerase specialized sigma24 family protein
MTHAEPEEACCEVRSKLEEFRRQSWEASFQLMYLHWIDEKNCEEIAAVLGCTTRQARDRHHRILLKLRSILRDPIDDDRG